MKKSLALFAAVLCAAFSLFAQAPTIEWQNTIGGSEVDALYGFDQTADGGYILSGFSNSNISGDKTENSWNSYDYWVVKLDANGNIQWQNTIGGTGEEQIGSVQQTRDGGYIIGGHSQSNASGDKTENTLGGSDYWVVKLDTNGNIQWQNTIGGSGNEHLWIVRQTNDDGYIIGGNSNSNISGDKTENRQGGTDYWIVKLDTVGNVQWQNTIGGNSNDILYGDVEQTRDGGYIIGGVSYSDISGDKTENSLGSTDYWILKLDSLGNIQWQNTIGGAGPEDLASIQQTSDGGYIIGGNSNSDISGDKTENDLGLGDYWIVKLDTGGNIQWQNTIGSNENDALSSLNQTADGGYIIGGSSSSNISGDKTEDGLGGDDYWILKLDSAGNIQWQNTIGGNDYDYLYSIQQTSEGAYVITGSSNSNISGDKTENSLGAGDYWIVKLSPEIVPVSETSIVQNRIEIYPNPTTSALFVKAPKETNLSLYNSIGQMISTQIIEKEGQIDLSTLPDGLYFLVETETGVAHKILKIK